MCTICVPTVQNSMLNKFASFPDNHCPRLLSNSQNSFARYYLPDNKISNIQVMLPENNKNPTTLIIQISRALEFSRGEA